MNSTTKPLRGAAKKAHARKQLWLCASAAIRGRDVDSITVAGGFLADLERLDK